MESLDGGVKLSDRFFLFFTASWCCYRVVVGGVPDKWLVIGTLLMGALPARIAGVPRVVVVLGQLPS